MKQSQTLSPLPSPAVEPNERLNRIGFYFFMITLGLGVIVAFGSLLFF